MTQLLVCSPVMSGQLVIMFRLLSHSLLAHFMLCPPIPAVLTVPVMPLVSASTSLKALTTEKFRSLRKQPYRTLRLVLTWMKSVQIARWPSLQRSPSPTGVTQPTTLLQQFLRTSRTMRDTCGSTQSTTCFSKKLRFQGKIGVSSCLTCQEISQSVYSTTMTHRSRLTCE